MEFGANNIKKSSNKVVVAVFDKSHFTANNIDTTGEATDTEQIPLIVIDNEGNIVTEY